MKEDPFGNLMKWDLVLDTLEELTENGDLSECQPGLIRILRYMGNWRLREEVLKRVGEVRTPSKELIHQVITILNDDNIYYDARIMAGNALVRLLQNTEDFSRDDTHATARKVVEKLKSTPQPTFFDHAIDRIYSELTE